MPDTTTRAREIRAELDASQLRESNLAVRIDQLIGWAKSGQRPEGARHPDYYVMRGENVDGLRNDIIDVIVAELSDPGTLLAQMPDEAVRNAFYLRFVKTERERITDMVSHACEVRSDGPYATPAEEQS